MKQLLFSVFFLYFSSILNSQEMLDFTTVFEKSQGTKTATYKQTIQFYTDLAIIYPEISIQKIGETDSGKPLHLVVLNADNISGSSYNNFARLRENKCILLINNGIHPGESDGIDATMLLFRDLAQGTIKMPSQTVIATIPIYNIGGSLNRNSNTRSNQNGPISYGFRGNARNYDLNRDFIKCDTKNTKTFATIFHLLQPDVFIDTHVSNGADYQYTLSHLFTQHNKLGGKLGDFLHNTMMPELEKKLTEKNLEITPYVNVFNQIPESGFSQFMDSPRYSTGYTALFNVLGMMVETHMLKPYKQRVKSTYELMKSMIDIIESDAKKVKELRADSYKRLYDKKSYPIDWTIDTTRTTILHFKGFEGKMIPSKITGALRLKYNRNKPFTKEVVYQNYFMPKLEITIPKSYIIPQGWHRIIDLLQLNNVAMKQFKKDTIIRVEVYKIVDFQTRKKAYEGHYPHYDVKLNILNAENIAFREGDYIIDTSQPSFRYILETLEPQAPDSFFNWNFFDTILQQKEGFSPYVWEDKALEILLENPILKSKFFKKRGNNKIFENNWYQQLDWLYKHSENYEKAHLQYPVYRELK